MFLSLVVLSSKFFLAVNVRVRPSCLEQCPPSFASCFVQRVYWAWGDAAGRVQAAELLVVADRNTVFDERNGLTWLVCHASKQLLMLELLVFE